MIAGSEWIFDGVARADSVVVNPHKWLFTPLDLSALYCRRMDVLRRALALTPDYLASRQPGTVTNYMDMGIQLGRRFRALKLWTVLRYFGADGIRARISDTSVWPNCSRNGSSKTRTLNCSPPSR